MKALGEYIHAKREVRARQRRRLQDLCGEAGQPGLRGLGSSPSMPGPMRIGGSRRPTQPTSNTATATRTGPLRKCGTRPCATPSTKRAAASSCRCANGEWRALPPGRRRWATPGGPPAHLRQLEILRVDPGQIGGARAPSHPSKLMKFFSLSYSSCSGTIR
jgi:hypothetical protein